MSLFFGSILPYLALAVFLAGMMWHVGRWLAQPVPFPLTLVRGETGVGRQAAAVARESLLFSALFRGDRRLWLTAWLMHASLLLILVGHVVGISCLARQFCWLGAAPETSVRISLVSGVAAGLVFVACLLLLARRRWAIPELRRLSRPGDYFLLGLLVGVAGTGLWLRCTATPTDLAAARSYLGGLLSLRPGALPQPVLFVLHLTLVNVLLSWFPFSKLVHLAGGIIARSLLVRPAPIYPTPAGAAPSGGLHAGGGRRP